MSRKRQFGGNPPSVIQVVNGGAGFPVPNIASIAAASTAIVMAMAIATTNKLVKLHTIQQITMKTTTMII